MKRLLIFSLILMGLSALQPPANAQGIDFFQGTWEEALEEAKAQQKVIFVDAYAVWCGPCRRMANNVFTHSKVGSFYNENFINLKLDMEAEENMTFRQKYPVSAFPTLYYIDFTGEVVQQVRGAQDVEGFLNLGSAALNKIDRSEEFAESYEAGNRDPELVYNYVRALNQAGKPSLKISNDYLRDQEDLTTETNLRFILEATVEADSRIFGLLIKHRDAIENLVGEELVKQRIQFACENTAQKAAEYKTEMLLEEAQDKMKDHYSAQAKTFKIQSNLEYYLARRNDKEYLKAAKAYSKKSDPDDMDLLRLSQDLWKYFRENPKCAKAAEGFAKDASENSKQYLVKLHYALLLAENGKKDKAIDVARQALELAKTAGRGPTMQVENFLQQLEG